MKTLDYVLEKYNIDWKGCTCGHRPIEHEHEVKGCTRCDCRHYITNLPLEIPNFGRDQLPILFQELGLRTVAEVGVFQGEYSEVLLRNHPEMKLFCVDSWQEHPLNTLGDQDAQNKNLAKTLKRLEPYADRVTFIREFSVEGAKRFPDNSLDAVYIDAAHDFVSLVNDFAAWIPKVRPHGIIAGHDYIQRGMGPTVFGKANKTFHVVNAVHGYTTAYSIDPWFALGRKHANNGEIRDKIRSFMWLKDERD